MISSYLFLEFFQIFPKTFVSVDKNLLSVFTHVASIYAKILEQKKAFA